MGQFSSVPQSYRTLCDPMDCSTPGFPVHHQLPELAQTPDIASVMPSSHLVLCRSRLLLPSVMPGRCSLPRAGRIFPLPLRLPTYPRAPAPPLSFLVPVRLPAREQTLCPADKEWSSKNGTGGGEGQFSIQGKNLRYPPRLNAVNIFLALWFPFRG